MVAVVKQKRVTNGSKVGDTSASEFDVVLVEFSCLPVAGI